MKVVAILVKILFIHLFTILMNVVTRGDCADDGNIVVAESKDVGDGNLSVLNRLLACWK